MRKCMAVLVILPRETFDVVLASRNWALFWSFILVSEHVCLQVFKDASTLWQWAHSLLTSLVVVIAASTLAACARVVRAERVDGASPLIVVLGVRLVLLSVKVWTGTTLLDAC